MRLYEPVSIVTRFAAINPILIGIEDFTVLRMHSMRSKVPENYSYTHGEHREIKIMLYNCCRMTYSSPLFPNTDSHE